MKPDEALARAFHCPKCNGRQCHVMRVHMPQGMIPLPMGHFYAATCTLCGLTEFYNQAVFDASLSSQAEEAPAPDMKPARG
jgi:predicted nucleic-acid-binding Zn-ribbon protein